MAHVPSFPVPPCLVLTGPTAVGKTGILELLAECVSKKIEVISADAFQVYRGLDKGTAKPDKALLQKIPHHLIDIRFPQEPFNVGDFVRLAQDLIQEIRARNAIPVICGGTIFYLKHLIEGLPEAPPSSIVVRAELQLKWDRGEAAALVDELLAVDPVSAGRIHANDAYRIIRALEVWRSSGRPLSSYEKTAKKSGDYLVIGLQRPRDELINRIANRVQSMLDAGLAEEVLELTRHGVVPQDPGMKAIGYQEFFRFTGPDWSARQDLDAVKNEIIIHTRQYAKRQMTFLHGLSDVIWLDAGNAELAVQEILRHLDDLEPGRLT
jgi:tRNA dimethylallyltransferase